MSFFVSESIKDKINEETLDKQLENKSDISFPMYIYGSNRYYEVVEINKYNDKIEAELILTNESYVNLLKNNNSTEFKLCIFNTTYCKFNNDDIMITNFKSIEKYLIRVKILINNSEMENKND